MVRWDRRRPYVAGYPIATPRTPPSVFDTTRTAPSEARGRRPARPRPHQTRGRHRRPSPPRVMGNRDRRECGSDANIRALSIIWTRSPRSICGCAVMFEPVLRPGDDACREGGVGIEQDGSNKDDVAGKEHRCCPADGDDPGCPHRRTTITGVTPTGMRQVPRHAGTVPSAFVHDVTSRASTSFAGPRGFHQRSSPPGHPCWPRTPRPRARSPPEESPGEWWGLRAGGEA